MVFTLSENGDHDAGTGEHNHDAEVISVIVLSTREAPLFFCFLGGGRGGLKGKADISARDVAFSHSFQSMRADLKLVEAPAPFGLLEGMGRRH
jgi:hypothetical protein